MVKSTIQIPLGGRAKGKFAIIDESDVHLLGKSSWCLTTAGYPWAKRNGCNVLLHRLILPTSHGLVVDHINGDKLDNRRCNLRAVTHGENVRNAHHDNTPSETRKLKGVVQIKGIYYPRVRVNGKDFYGSGHTDIQSAYRDRDKLAVKHQGANARLNFP